MSIFEPNKDWFRTQLQNVGLWAGILGLIILLTSEVFHSSINETVERLAHEVGFALFIAAILVLTVEKRSRTEFNRIFEHYLSLLNGSMAQKLSQVFGTMRIARIPDEMNNNSSEELRLISAAIHSKYLDGLRTVPGGIHLDEIDWALESNRIFYESLTMSNCQNGEVRITHTGSIETWLNVYQAEKSLEQQRKFKKEKKMTVTRIFIGKKPLKEDEQYLKVIKLMSTFGITCGYLQHSDPTSIIDMTWIPQIHLLSVWKPGVSGGVASIELTEDNVRADLEIEWTTLKKQAVFPSIKELPSIKEKGEAAMAESDITGEA